MAKLSVSVDVPLPPEQAWECASDLSRYKEWLTIHRVWRSPLPDTLEKGTTIDSIVEVKGMANRVKWTIVHYKPPHAMTLANARAAYRAVLPLLSWFCPCSSWLLYPLLQRCSRTTGKITPHRSRT